MLVFSTRLLLKDHVTQEMCLKLFIEWITGSKHYAINEITYDLSSQDDYRIEQDNAVFSIGHYNDENIKLAACRLENKEAKAVWFNDCIFVDEGHNKAVLIQLNCNLIDYNTQLPDVHKPYIVRKFVDSGYCADDAGLPVLDIPIIANDDTINLISKIMNFETQNKMPVVYVSCDYGDQPKINASFLARQLSGVAHVFLETSRKTSLKLREMTDGKNVHNGYVGIYFPGSYCERFNVDSFNYYKEAGYAIIDSVWQALINRIDSSVYNWSQIMTLQAKQRMMQMKAANQEELVLYANTFDSENNELRSKIEDLNEQNANLRARLEALQYAVNSEQSGEFLRMGVEPDLYPGEHNDLLRSILTQVQHYYDSTSRAHNIIDALLEANPSVGECKRILSTIKGIFSGGARLKTSDKSKLKDLGFEILEDGASHYKLVFHDSRYMFTVAKTPSDHREGKNLYSDICRVIDIDKKIL